MTNNKKSQIEENDLNDSIELIKESVPNHIKFLQDFQRYVEVHLSEADKRDQDLITYTLHVVITIIILARLAGHTSAVATNSYWFRNKDNIQKILYGCDDSVASASTIGRVINKCDPDKLFEEYCKSMGNLYTLVRKVTGCYNTKKLAERDVLAVDGQALKATRSEKYKTGMDCTSLVSSRFGLTLAQDIAVKKNQECKAIEKILKAKDENGNLIDISNTTVCCDAMNTRPNIVKIIIDGNADYFLCLKSNQGTLFEEIEESYKVFDEGNFYNAKNSVEGSYSYNSGNFFYEKKIVLIDAKSAVLPEQIKKWDGLATIARIETTATSLSALEKTESVRYFISSIPIDYNDKNFAETMIKISLKRWCVETNHWYLDLFYDQDRAKYKNQNSAGNTTLLSKLSVSTINFAKRAYKSAPNCFCDSNYSISRIQNFCDDSKFGCLLLQAFFDNDPNKLLTNELSYEYHFLKEEKAEKEVFIPRENNYGVPTDSTLFDSPLHKMLKERKKKKRIQKEAKKNS